MKTILVRYKTHDAQADTNEALIHAVFDELRSAAPAGIRYESFRLPDRVTFVHIVTVETPGKNPLQALTAFKVFQRGLPERCVELPVVTELSAVDSYACESLDRARIRGPFP